MFQELFEGYELDEKRAISYGLKFQEGAYFFEQEFMDHMFLLHVVFRDSQMDFSVIDQETGDEYIQVKMEQMVGEFVGKVREACQEIFLRLRAACFDAKGYLHEQTKRVLDHIEETYGNHVEYLWKNSPHSGAIRHTDSKKWYGVLMVLDWSKLDPTKTGKVEVLNLKQEGVQDLLQEKGIFPAFHMNKKYWVSLILDDSLSDERLKELIHYSWQATAQTKK